ncbi:Myosin light chain alkali [Vespula squamosa]|uniref:Myosin light chain alkali n=1 Tax=Vespula squamosa TaxID=30214 RepID=A0ABD2A3B9_VESSQ
MPQDTAETFARGLVDQIVSKAFDKIKIQLKKGHKKIFTIVRHVDTEEILLISVHLSAEVSYNRMQRSDTYTEHNEGEGKEVTESMIHDLRSVQIGDSSYILSCPMSLLERQMRRTACFIDNTTIDNTVDVVEMSDIQGQGDVEPIAYDAESSKKKRTKSATYSKEREQPGTNDATAKVSINMLHRMIEELETVTEETILNRNGAGKPNEKIKEDGTIWEEKEEKLIRIIEDTEGSHESITEESRSIRQFVDEDRDELKSSMMMSGASSSRNLSFDEVYLEENATDYPPRRTSIDEIEETHDFSAETKETDKKIKSKRKKKKRESLGRRLKRQTSAPRTSRVKAEFAFSIYDADGTNVVDCVDLGNVLRALNLNPTNATIEKLGGTKKKGEKKMKLDEFLPIFSQCKKDKEQGCFEDFVECLKLYDKQENGTMLAAELSHTLLSLGERLADAEVETVLKDCMDPEDDDGFIPYTRNILEEDDGAFVSCPDAIGALRSSIRSYADCAIEHKRSHRYKQISSTLRQLPF